VTTMARFAQLAPLGNYSSNGIRGLIGSVSRHTEFPHLTLPLTLFGLFHRSPA